jgi:hypothetical protein
MDIIQDTNASELASGFLPRAQTQAADIVDQVAREGYVPATLDLVINALVAAYEAGKNYAQTEKEIAAEKQATIEKQTEAVAAKAKGRR